MRKQNVKAGEVYAYREGTWGGYQQVKVFDLDQLYSVGWSTPLKEAPAGFRAGKSHRTTTGYIAAIGADVSKASLEEAVRDSLRPPGDAKYRYKVLHQMRDLHGPYEEVSRAYREAQETAEAARQRHEAQRREAADRAERAAAGLRRHGITATAVGSQVHLSTEQVERIAELLDAAQEGRA